MNKYKNFTIESICELIKLLGRSKEVCEIISDNSEIRGINNLTDALLDIDLIYSIYSIAEDEYLVDIDVIEENLKSALADAINKENIEDVKTLIRELEELFFLQYEYFTFIIFGFLSEESEIDMRDFTTSLHSHFKQLVSINNIEYNSFETEKAYQLLKPQVEEIDEDYEFKKVCKETADVIYENLLCIKSDISVKYQEIEFIQNDYNE